MKKDHLAVYTRTSTDEQRKNQTVEGQFERIPKDLKRMALLDTDGGKFTFFPRTPDPKQTDPKRTYFLDDGFNLEVFPFPENSAIHELLTLIEAGQIQAVYVDTIDRLLRSSKPTPRAYIQEKFEDHDVRLFTHQGETTIGLVMELTAAISADDKRKIGRRLHSNKKMKSRNYNAPGGGPPSFGFRWLRDKNQWELIEDEIKWVRWAAGLTLGRGATDMPESIRTLADQHPDGVHDPAIIEAFEALGLNLLPYYNRANLRSMIERNPTGALKKDWVQSILRFDRYCGYRIYSFYKDSNDVGKKKPHAEKEREDVTIKLPKVFEPTEWAAIQSARRRRSCFYGKNVKQQYLLERLAHCSLCGSTLSARSSHIKKYVRCIRAEKKYIIPYYVCPKHKKSDKSPCPHRRTHNARVIDPIVWKAVADFIRNPTFIRSNEQAVREDVRLNSIIEKLISENEGVNTALRCKEAEAEKLITFLRRGLISEPEFLVEKKNIADEAQSLRRAHARTAQEIKSKQRLLANIDRIDMDEIRGRYENRLESLDFDDRQLVVRTVAKQIVIRPNGQIDITFRLGSV